MDTLITRYTGTIDFENEFYEDSLKLKSCIKRQSEAEKIIRFEFDEYFVTIYLNTMLGVFSKESRHWYHRGVQVKEGKIKEVKIEGDVVKGLWVEGAHEYEMIITLKLIEEFREDL